MLPETVRKRLEALGEVSRQGKRVNGLFRLMESQEMYLKAYANIYANDGATTKGVDGVTMDGFSEDRVANLIEPLKEHRYTPKPVQRVYIPKKNGKLRPLGMPSGDDKLVQEVARMLLERIYEPVFSKNSHGFRTKRSCHTALEDIKRDWCGVKWIIEVDIKGFYDNINHKKLKVFFSRGFAYQSSILLKVIKRIIVKTRILKIATIIFAITRMGFLTISGIGGCGVVICYTLFNWVCKIGQVKTMIAQPEQTPFRLANHLKQF